MVYIKPEFLRRQKGIDLDDVFKYDELPEKGLSAGLVLKIDSPAKSGLHYDYASGGDKWRMVDWITEVKVLTDGKRPLKDMGGAELQASEYWNSGQPAVDKISDRTQDSDHCLIPLAWGRKLGDLEYYLNWGNYSSIELQVKNIMSYFFDSASIDIINLKIVDGEALPPSKGLFQERIWREYTTVQDKKEYFKLPVGDPLRRIMLRAVPDQESSYPFRRSDNFYDLIEEIKLTFGDGGEVALDTYSVEQMELMHMLHDGLVHVGGMGLANTATQSLGIRTGIGRARSKSAIYANITTTQPAYDLSYYTYMDDLQCLMITTGASNEYVHWDIWGLGYNLVIPIRFDLGGIDKILDTQAKAPIQLELDCENSSTAEDGTVQIILSDLVSR